MRPADHHPEIQHMLRMLRIVVPVLAAGVAVFLGYVAWDHYVGDGAADKPGQGMLTWIALGLSVVNVIMFGSLRRVVMRQARKRYEADDVPGFVGRYQAATIMWAAGLEGGGLITAIAFLLEGHVLTLALGVFMVFLILLSIPTRGRVDALL